MPATTAESLPWTKWYWEKWEAEPTLRLCSLAAQGLWMRLLCLMAKEGGYLRINGRPPSLGDLSRVVGHPKEEIQPLLGELERQGVFTRTTSREVFCRRMVKTTSKQGAGRVGGFAKAQNLQADPVLLDPEGEGEGEVDTPQPPRGSGTRPLRRGEIEAIWQMATRVSRGRSSIEQLEKSMRAAYDRGHGFEAIQRGIRGYFASREARREDGVFAKGVHRIVAGDRFLAFTAEAKVHKIADADPWPSRMRLFASTGRWEFGWGPEPGKDGCKAPEELLAAWRGAPGSRGEVAAGEQ